MTASEPQNPRSGPVRTARLTLSAIVPASSSTFASSIDRTRRFSMSVDDDEVGPLPRLEGAHLTIEPQCTGTLDRRHLEHRTRGHRTGVAARQLVQKRRLPHRFEHVISRPVCRSGSAPMGGEQQRSR